jgi:hypothetical protein
VSTSTAHGAAFAAMQWVAHEWAVEVHLTADHAHLHMITLADTFGLPRIRFLWEADGVLGDDLEAATIRNRRTENRAVVFRGLGCTLWVLCHELVHAWRTWDEPYHDDTDWDLCTIFLEECRAVV